MFEISPRKRTRVLLEPSRAFQKVREQSRTTQLSTFRQKNETFLHAPRYSVATKRDSREANYSRESSSTCDTCSSIFLRSFSISFPFVRRVLALLLVFLTCPTHPPMEASRGLAKSRPDWSSAEASRSGRFGVLKARRVTRVISFATNATECKCDKWREVSTCESNYVLERLLQGECLINIMR